MLDQIFKLFQKPTDTDANGYVLRHENYTAEKPNLHKEKFFEFPIARNVIQQEITSKYDFIEFVNQYKTQATKIFYNERMIRAVFNYSTPEKADYGDSFARMELQQTRDYMIFAGSMERDLSQSEFVTLLKRLEPYITEFDKKPVDDMDIIEVAENLQATKNINSVMRNTKHSFVLDAEVRSGNTNIEIPRIIAFNMPIFKNDLLITSKLDAELFLHAGEDGFVAKLVCYKMEQSIEETVKEITRQVCQGCGDIDAFMI